MWPVFLGFDGYNKICSLNLNLLMRDLSRARKAADAAQV
jgi:hypothetical protein